MLKRFNTPILQSETICVYEFVFDKNVALQIQTVLFLKYLRLCIVGSCEFFGIYAFCFLVWYHRPPMVSRSFSEGSFLTNGLFQILQPLPSSDPVKSD